MMVEGVRIAYLNARLLDPDSGLDALGALLVEGGRIADFSPDLFRRGAPSVGRVVDCKGLCLAPGLIDMRVNLREPGEEHKETFETASAAALAGGVTTMVALPSTKPVIDDVPGVRHVARRAREVRGAKIQCYAAATKGMKGKNLTEIGLLQQAGAVAFTDGERAIASSRVMARALSYAKAFEALLIQHPEEPELAGGVMNKGELASRLGLSGVPREVEVIMVERDLRLVEMTGARCHFSRLSTAAGIEAVRQAKKRGLPVTCDTAPPYFILNEQAVIGYRTFARLSPPLRREEDRLAVIAGLADGTIDIIASDHAPQDQESKRLPFAAAAPGGVGLETLLPLVLGLSRDGHMSLLEALACVTRDPAALLGLEGGCLKKGGPADLVLFDPDKPWTVREEDLHSKSHNTPFDGLPVHGKVQATVVDGRMLYQDVGFSE